jgi:protein disulfide-isomerase
MRTAVGQPGGTAPASWRRRIEQFRRPAVQTPTEQTKTHPMKTSLLTVLTLAAALTSASALQWHTDLPKAQELAKKENKLVLMNFTGSDWCGWCIKLKKDVFDTEKFKAYAEKNLVLVEIDFPRRKEQSEELKKANQALQRKYKIQGYPTLIVLNGDGKPLGELGYEKTPEAFIAKLEAAAKKK